MDVEIADTDRLCTDIYIKIDSLILIIRNYLGIEILSLIIGDFLFLDAIHSLAR